MSFSTEQVRAVIIDIAAVIEENKELLTDLDRAIGDSDHGHNLARGFGAVVKKLTDNPGTNVGEVLKTTAMALISTVGGASGPLYGSLFLQAGKAAADKTALSLSDFAAVLKEGINSVQARGHAVLGEKTMLDVLIPVAGSIERDAAAGVDAVTALTRAAALANECSEKTKDVVATKGRAAYLGERSIGHVDPGSKSSALIIETIARAAGCK
jgi:dihydroxyacetone kinase-like protein